MAGAARGSRPGGARSAGDPAGFPFPGSLTPCRCAAHGRSTLRPYPSPSRDRAARGGSAACPATGVTNREAVRHPP